MVVCTHLRVIVMDFICIYLSTIGAFSVSVNAIWRIFQKPVPLCHRASNQVYIEELCTSKHSVNIINS